MSPAQPFPTPFDTPTASYNGEPARGSKRAQVVQSIDSALRASAAQETPRVELWPFTVRVVHSQEDLAKAVRVRSAAYGHHVPELGSKLAAPEEADAHDIVLLAEAKFDGTPLGTMRIRTNERGDLQVQQVLELPPAMRGARLAEATRLAVRGAGDGRMVRDALFKAFYLVCVQLGVDYMVITARKPLDRIYEWMGFQDVGQRGEFIPVSYVGNIPHRILAFKLQTAQQRWQEMAHPLYSFMCDIAHPDLSLELGFRSVAEPTHKLVG